MKVTLADIVQGLEDFFKEEWENYRGERGPLEECNVNATFVFEKGGKFYGIGSEGSLATISDISIYKEGYSSNDELILYYLLGKDLKHPVSDMSYTEDIQKNIEEFPDQEIEVVEAESVLANYKWPPKVERKEIQLNKWVIKGDTDYDVTADAKGVTYGKEDALLCLDILESYLEDNPIIEDLRKGIENGR